MYCRFFFFYNNQTFIPFCWAMMGLGRILMVNDIQMDHLNAIENDKMYACGLANVHRHLFVLHKV